MTVIDLTPAPLTAEFAAAANTAWSHALGMDVLALTSVLAGMSKAERADVALAADVLRATALAEVA